MKTKITITIIALAILVIAGFVMSKNDSPETIRVGTLLCLTGDCAEWGENSLRGLQLAAEEINGSGGGLGKQVELVVQDSEETTNVANAVSGYQQLVRGGVEYIVGPSWTPAGLAIHPIAAGADTLITSPSLGVAEFNEAADNIFNTWTHDAIATEALAELAIEKGWRRAAIFSSKQAWEQTQGNVFEETFTALGGEVVFKVEPHEDTTDLRTGALKMVNANPDVVVFSNFAHMGIAAKELMHFGYEGAQLSVLMDESRVEIAQGGLEGTIYAQYPAASQDFVEMYSAKFGEEPGITADTAYDALMLYAVAIEKAETVDTAVVKDVLNNMNTYKGASGEMVFDGKGGVIRDVVFWTVEGGEFELL